MKVMSKMGISTYMSYTGAQIFEAVGLAQPLVQKYFRGTASNVSGIGLFEVAEHCGICHAHAIDEHIGRLGVAELPSDMREIAGDAPHGRCSAGRYGSPECVDGTLKCLGCLTHSHGHQDGNHAEGLIAPEMLECWKVELERMLGTVRTVSQRHAG